VAAQARAAWGEGQVRAELAALAKRLFGFELLVGPYTVAHYRLLRATNPGGGAPGGRMNVYLADTLTPPAGALGVTPHLGFLSAPIVEERRAADRLKRDTPILAIFGNPPYRRLDAGEEAAIVRGWDNGFWEDLKAPVRAAGWGGELNTFPDLYVAFWRWCIWKLFESEGAPGRGVVCLITNRTFLAGHPYAGLRQMLRRRFDFIDIVDLRGDGRAAHPAGITADENVFEIQAGVCILIAIATGKPRMAGTEAEVRYADVWRHGAFKAQAKLALLDRAADAADVLSPCHIAATAVQDFTPRAFRELDWPALARCFAFSKSGSKSQRDALAYGFSPARLIQGIRNFLMLPQEDARRLYFHRAKELSQDADGDHRGKLREKDVRSLRPWGPRKSEETRFLRARTNR
jgi:predicted helicase